MRRFVLVRLTDQISQPTRFPSWQPAFNIELHVFVVFFELRCRACKQVVVINRYVMRHQCFLNENNLQFGSVSSAVRPFVRLARDFRRFFDFFCFCFACLCIGVWNKRNCSLKRWAITINPAFKAALKGKPLYFRVNSSLFDVMCRTFNYFCYICPRKFALRPSFCLTLQLKQYTVKCKQRKFTYATSTLLTHP